MQKKSMFYVKSKFADDQFARRKRAAAHPACQEFESFIEDAAKLQARMRKWIKKHDVPEDTAGVISMSIALARDEKDDETPPYALQEWFHALRGIEWALRSGVNQIYGHVGGRIWTKLNDVQQKLED